MRATLALLLPRPLENAIQQFAWHTYLRWQTGIFVRRLPPHISLKQTFEIGDDLSKLHRYFADFAKTVPSLTLSLSTLIAWDTLLVAGIEKNPAIRRLHERLNHELTPLFGDVRADFDGDDYKFHVTISAGGAAQETYTSIVDFFRTNPPPFIGSPFEVREIALFVYNEPQPGVWEYMIYETLPLTGKTSPIFESNQ